VFHVKQPVPAGAQHAHEAALARPPLPEGPPTDPALAAKLDAFLALLLRWNPRINLVAEASPAEIRSRHIEDSLQLLPLLPPGPGPLGDLGSGGGFPGLILALATGREAHLVESDRRKAAFLTEAAARLGLTRVTVHATRAESATLPPLGVLTARALAPLTALLPHAARFLAPNGIALFPKGRTAEAELTAAAAFWTFRVQRFASRTDPAATLLQLSEIQRVGTDA
jgi:16S rRNA (guanine527-N7)-methyltransferase